MRQLRRTTLGNTVKPRKRMLLPRETWLQTQWSRSSTLGPLRRWLWRQREQHPSELQKPNNGSLRQSPVGRRMLLLMLLMLLMLMLLPSVEKPTLRLLRRRPPTLPPHTPLPSKPPPPLPLENARRVRLH